MILTTGNSSKYAAETAGAGSGSSAAGRASDAAKLAIDVGAEILRGAATPDYFSSRAGKDLQAILRDSPPTLPIETLVNTGAVSLDLPNWRVNRDLFWKGSFAKDSLVGFEERLRDLLDSERGNAATFARGAFWKRFDAVKDGVATGYVVNYDLQALPGDPVVRTVAYPDGQRRYFHKGDTILLLTYRNDPYKPVYDAIKIIDNNNAIGVMHLGEFPNGLEFATFVMARYSYPLDRMSIDDYRAIAQQSGAQTVDIKFLQGRWNGSLILQQHPNTALLSPPTPVTFELSAGDSSELRFGSGPSVPWSGLPDAVASMRMLDADTVIGARAADQLSPALLDSLRDYLPGGSGPQLIYYVLRRAGAAPRGGREL